VSLRSVEAIDLGHAAASRLGLEARTSEALAEVVYEISLGKANQHQAAELAQPYLRQRPAVARPSFGLASALGFARSEECARRRLTRRDCCRGRVSESDLRTCDPQRALHAARLVVGDAAPVPEASVPELERLRGSRSGQGL